ncbi:Gfo/Idh/MocA family protein [Steroidobacter cummioxidans]|uniref:Gfo/Idh/MocA family protein n=1 Tax=Steroidobacter cummioxidans TaxID=1803913 RepID=UPI000E317F00|nr:Gfo/Idh/MocA family oxidoreductase [Steroidobacter cummioxidans]
MSARPRVSHSPPRVGFVGLGWIGRKRLDALTADDAGSIDVAALVDSDADRLRAAARAHPGAATAPTVDPLFDADLDAVVIATPSGLHAHQVIACLEQGLAVFCQKPLATTLLDVHRALAAARASDRLLGIDFCYRHITGMPELRRRLMSGAIGEIIAIDLVFNNAYGPDQSWCRNRALAGGGCLLDLGVHLLDLALWVQCMPPIERVRSRLFAHGQPTQGCDGELEDLAYAEFVQANGAMVRLCCSWHAHIGQPAQIQMDITGTRGGASWCNVNGSFYDFDVHWLQGANREQLGASRDDWGTRALRAWLRQLAASNRFDVEAENIARSAALIEEVYRA